MLFTIAQGQKRKKYYPFPIFRLEIVNSDVNKTVWVLKRIIFKTQLFSVMSRKSTFEPRSYCAPYLEIHRSSIQVDLLWQYRLWSFMFGDTKFISLAFFASLGPDDLLCSNSMFYLNLFVLGSCQ